MTNFADLFSKVIDATPDQVLPIVLQIFVGVFPIVLAVILFVIFWPIWVTYIRSEFHFKEKYTVLEIKLPKETHKSPLSMEIFLMSLHQTGGEGNWYDKYWLGKTRPWFSLEMVSIEGNVHFFIWTRSKNASFISSSLYAQYPGIEVHEVNDYTKSVHFDAKTMNIWGCELELTKPDPYPIKTYVDYGMDKDTKEEFRIDPIAPLIEFLGSIGSNQSIWIQIVTRAHKKEHLKPGHWWKATDKWKDEAQDEINKLMMRDPKTKAIKVVVTEDKQLTPKITKGEEEVITALERSISKQGFDVGIRLMYIAKKESFNPANIGGLTGSFKQFSSEHLNGFKPRGDKYSPSFSYPWQDYKEIRQNSMRKSLLEAYKRRSFFHDPVKGKVFVLNSEELATIFHFPGQVSQTPTLSRIPSVKGDAPSNLPI